MSKTRILLLYASRINVFPKKWKGLPHGQPNTFIQKHYEFFIISEQDSTLSKSIYLSKSFKQLIRKTGRCLSLATLALTKAFALCTNVVA